MLRLSHYLKPIVRAFLIILFVLFGLSAFGQEKKDKTYIKTTEEGTVYELVGWETDIVYNPHTFTWFVWEDPVLRETKVEKTKMVPVSEFDRPPVFSGECLRVEDQFACSNNKWQEYFEENYFEYPEPARYKGQEGLEYVTFTIDKNGDFEGNLKVLSKNEPCKGCSDAAADIIAGTEDMWFPAIKDGKTVKTQLTVPVRFQLIDK